MTKYRKINNGHWNFLQYEKECTFLFFKWKRWEYVWKPYYDKIYGRTLDVTGYHCQVNDLTENLEAFVQRWRDIEDYFNWAEIEQRRLESKAMEWQKRRDSKNGQISPL
jgi:hypothetical protein